MESTDRTGFKVDALLFYEAFWTHQPLLDSGAYCTSKQCMCGSCHKQEMVLGIFYVMMKWAGTGNWKRDDVLSSGASQEAQNPGNPRWTSEICGVQSRQDPLCHPHWTGDLDLVQPSKFSFHLSADEVLICSLAVFSIRLALHVSDFVTFLSIS